VSAPRFLAAAAALALCGGCGQLDLTPEGNPARVLAGEIRLADAAELPPDASATVRVVDANQAGQPPVVLGSETLRHLGTPPITFRVEYQAVDERLRQGLNIEVRVSSGGQVRYFNRNRYALTLANVADVHRVYVDRAQP
jgi:uncharacterized lipoprotein YbaY